MVKLVAIALLAACAHDYRPPADPRGAWLYARGIAGWTTCVRIAAALRAPCGRDAPCGRRVSEDFSYHCYAGAYRGGGTADSPCLHADEPPQRTCAALQLGDALFPHCEAELRFYAHEVCKRGDPTLTGAGP